MDLSHWILLTGQKQRKKIDQTNDDVGKFLCKVINKIEHDALDNCEAFNCLWICYFFSFCSADDNIHFRRNPDRIK